MKYLVLLLSLFMFGNVKAEGTYKDIYLSLSYEEKEMKQDLCEFGFYIVETSYAQKSDDCVLAYFFLDEKENKSATLHFRERHHLEKYRYLVKAGNYSLYALSKDSAETNEIISKTIHDKYNNYCTYEIKSQLLYQTVLCENLLMYKGFDRARVRTSERSGDIYISK